MKNIKITASINPVNYAVNNYNADNCYVELASLKYDEEEQETSAKFIPLNLTLVNVTDVRKFRKLVIHNYYKQVVSLATDALMAIQKKQGELEQAEKFEQASKLDEKIEALETIIEDYTSIRKALPIVTEEVSASVNTFASFVASAVSGYVVAGASCKEVANSFAKQLKKEATDKETKEVISSVLERLSVKEDTGIVKKYRMNVSASLYKDLESRFYKGRKLDAKTGRIKKTYDTDGNILVKELTLAIVEDLQRKATTKKQESNKQ